MRKLAILLILVVAAALYMQSCRKSGEHSLSVPDDVMARIAAVGYDTSLGVIRSQDGYLVEGDIYLTDAVLAAMPTLKKTQFGSPEQYRMTQLVTGLPRTVNVYSAMTGVWNTAINDAIARFNALNLRITFQRIATSTGANITVIASVSQGGPGLASGPPTSSGNPFPSIWVNNTSTGAGANPPLGFATTQIAHEMGHCIGLQHTDWQDRTLSCQPVATGQEPNNGAGYINIPGTPTGNDLNSWMLACNLNQADRPFTCNDATALRTLYGTLYTLTQVGSCVSGSQSTTFTISGRAGDVVTAELTMTGDVRWNGSSTGAGGSISLNCNSVSALGSSTPITNTVQITPYTVSRSITFTMTAATATLTTAAAQLNSNVNNNTSATLRILKVNGANANCTSKPACWMFRNGAL